MEKYARKRIIIIVVYLLLLALVVFGVYSFLKAEETCLDGVKNQNEEEIDCGGVCKKCDKVKALDLKVISYGFLERWGNMIFGRRWKIRTALSARENFIMKPSSKTLKEMLFPKRREKILSFPERENIS